MANRPHKGVVSIPHRSKTPSASAETDLPLAPPDAIQVAQVHPENLGPVVGIVASAGGLVAFNQFFQSLPTDSGAAFVVVPHLDATHKSMMVELLSRETTMPVVESNEGTTIEPNCVYVIPPNHVMTIEKRTLRLGVLPKTGQSQTAIDVFLRSLALDQGEQSIGIVLSGTGSHGTLGIREIKRCGGMAMAQSPESAEFDQMPQSAIETGLVDFIMPPAELAATLIKYLHQPYVSLNRSEVAPSETATQELTKILKLIREQTKYDFSCYRTNMLSRRTERRMGLMQISSMSEYLQVLQKSPSEAQALSKDFLIGVTAFFREPAAFSILEHEIIPTLVAKHTKETPARVWVAGCATGEEAYSIAILLFEAVVAADKLPNFQIFASDINEAAIDFARRGLFPASVASDISEDRLARFFVRKDDVHFRVTKQLRESITFSVQNLILDAPFSKMDLISCRNLLIYLEPELQQKLIRLFHFALNQNGFLTLGPAETIGRDSNLFNSISKQWRVYSRAGPLKTNSSTSASGNTILNYSNSMSLPSYLPRKSYKEIAESIIVSEYSPATALINRQHEILNVTGPLVDYLEFPSGEISKHLLAMARPGLRSKLRSACHRAVQSQVEVRDVARVKRNGTYSHCCITVRPILEPNANVNLLLVLLHDQNPDPLTKGENNRPLTDPSDIDGTSETPLIDLLEYELKTTREELQNTIEQMGSANEELQSSNEELESSKEELQSLNEELNTVNFQLLEKVTELDKSNDEISNLMASTEIATLFVDNQLLIKRFTKPAIKLLDCNPTNIGRLITDIQSTLIDQGILAECKTVLDSHQPVESEIISADEQCYLRRILPYCIVDNETNGVVVTFINLTQRKHDEARQRDKDARYREVFQHASTGIFITNWKGDLEECNPAFCELLGYSEKDLLGEQFLSFVHHEDYESSLERFQELQSGMILPFEPERRFVRNDDQIVWIRKFTSAIPDTMGKAAHFVALVTDMTPQKKAEEELQLSEKKTRLGAERLRAILDTASDAIITFDNTGTIDSVNQATESIFGFTSAETVGMNFSSLMSPSFLIGREDFIQDFSTKEYARVEGGNREVTCRNKSGKTFPAELSVSRVDHLELFTGVLRDVSKRKAMQQHILEIAADEQRRIGLELHDGTQQELTGLTLYANAILETITNSPRLTTGQDSNSEPSWQFSELDYDRLKANTLIMARRLSEANRNVRDLAHGIMPVQVDAEGLRSALSELAEATNSERIQCRFECSGEFGSLHNTSATHLYRIAQEAVNNTLRHGDASEILISLTQQDSRIVLQVDDDGIGFDAANTSKGASVSSGMGLQTMEYRANLIGGSLSIKNKTNGGTEVKCLLSQEIAQNG